MTDHDAEPAHATPTSPSGQRHRLARASSRPRTLLRLPRWVWLVAAFVFIPAQLLWINQIWGERMSRPTSERAQTFEETEPSDRPEADEARRRPKRIGAPALGEEMRKRLARYAEVRDADSRVCALIRGAWGRRHRGAPGSNSRADSSKDPPSTDLRFRHWTWDRPPNQGALADIVKSAEERGACALLRVMFEEAPPDSHGTWPITQPDQDAEAQSLGLLLRESAPAELDQVFMRMVHDRGLYPGLRLKAIIALCRPGNTAAVEPLVGLARNRSERQSFRHDILLRLPRVGVPLLAHFREDLYSPFFDVDHTAAVALALAGELEAPSLLVEALRHGPRESSRAGPLTEIMLRATGHDPDVETAAKNYLRFFVPVRALEGGYEEDRKRCTRAAEALAGAFETWLAAHPETRETAFERRRAAYLAGQQRKREQAVRSFRDIVQRDASELDLATAALLCERVESDEEHAGHRRRVLARLSRFAHLLKQDIRGLDEPKAIIEAIRRRLYSKVEFHRGVWGDEDPPTTLSDASTGYAVNCLGGTLLWLALGERLDLPLYAVLAPCHIFVRWDDGTTRYNIETTAQGELRPDEHYRKMSEGGRRVTPRDLAAGCFLRNLTHKDVLACLLTNLSERYLEGRYWKEGDWRFHKVAAFASRAIRLSPSRPGAYYLRACANQQLGAPADAILADVREAVRLDDRSHRSFLWAGLAHERLGLHEAALAHFERARACREVQTSAELGRMRCLLALGQVERALKLAERRLKEEPDRHVTRCIRMRALVRLRDPRWCEDFQKLLSNPKTHPESLRLVAARLLLRPEPDARPEPEAAIVLLDKIEDNERAAGNKGGFAHLKRPDGHTLRIDLDTIRAIQRERDELRAQAQAMLNARNPAVKENP